jgi:RNA-splicing ligase RtcB
MEYLASMRSAANYAFANRQMFARNDKEIICVNLAAP